MKKEQNTRYYLTSEEWALLLASAKIEKIYGFPFSGKAYSRNQVIIMLETMVKKGLIVSDGRIFHIHPGIKEILDCVKTCEKMISMEDGKEENATFCLYIGDTQRLAVLMPAGNNSGIRAWCMGKEELFVWLGEAGYLPDCYLSAEALPGQEWKEGFHQKIHWQMVKRDVYDGTSQKILFLQQSGLYYRILRQSMTGENETWEFYGERQLNKAISWIMEE